MIRKFVIASILSLSTLAFAAPATAADAASLDCVRQKAGEAVIQQLTDQIATGLIAKKADALKPDWTPLVVPLRACIAANNWSTKASNIASQVVIATVMRGAIVRALQNDGIDPALVTTLFRSMPVSARRAFLADETQEEGAKAFEPVLRARKIDPNGFAGEHIGMLAAALALIEFRPAEFAAA